MPPDRPTLDLDQTSTPCDELQQKIDEAMRERPPLDLDPTTTPLQELIPVGRWLGMKSESAIYDAANRGQIPTIVLGRRKMVPTAELRRMVGLDQADEDQAPTLRVVGGDR